MKTFSKILIAAIVIAGLTIYCSSCAPSKRGGCYATKGMVGY